MDVPTIVIAAQDMLGLHFLRVQNSFTARLRLDVIGDGPFARGVGEGEAAKNVLRRLRRNGVFTARRSI